MECHREGRYSISEDKNVETAIALLERYAELEFELDMDDVDLKPLAKMPGFKTLKADYQN